MTRVSRWGDGEPPAGAAVPPPDALAARYAVERRLSAVAEAGGGLAALVRSVHELTGNRCCLFDAQDRLVAAGGCGRGGPPIPCPSRLRDVVGSTDPGRPAVTPPLRERGLAHRHLMAPVARAGEVFGRLVIAEHPVPFPGIAHYVALRAADYLATEYVTQRRIAQVAWNARASLTRQLIGGTAGDSDLRASAEYLGVNLAVDRLLAFVTDSEGELGADDLAQMVSDALGLEVLPVRGSEGVALAVESAADTSPGPFVGRVRRAVAAALAAVGGAGNVAGLSGVARPGELRRAYREARETALCVRRFGGPYTRVVAADDLGPARLFLANSEVGAVRAFVQDVLGPLLSGTPRAADLLRTLLCFFETGRSVHESAGVLGVHENTVRLRLARVHDLTGLNVAAAPTDQLSVQTALLVLRLRGDPALTAADTSVVELIRRIA